MECADKSKPAPALALPNELWVAILKNIDIYHVLELSLVCKHFNRLIFAHMADRFEFKLSKDVFHRKHGLRLVPERTYKHIAVLSSRLELPDKLFDAVKQLAPNVESVRVVVGSVECKVLMKLLEPCTQMTKLSITAHVLENNDTLNEDDPIVVFPAVSSLVVDVEEFGNVEEFLPCMPNVRKLEISLLPSVARESIIERIFAALSDGFAHVESLEVFGYWPIAINECVRMKCLKEVILNELDLLTSGDEIVPLPQVEIFEAAMKMEDWDDISIILTQFPNLKRLTLFMRCPYKLETLQSLVQAAHCLKELQVEIPRITLGVIDAMLQLTSLEKLSIYGTATSKAKFSLLGKVMVLPELRRLAIATECSIPAHVASAVAAKNRTCKFMLNDKLVSPTAANVRRDVGMEGKHPGQE